MIKFRRTSTIVSSSLLLIVHTIIPQMLHKALVVASVVDLVGQPMKTLFPKQSIKTSYNQIPLHSTDIYDNHACVRLHQLLFNDFVEVVKQRNNEVLIRISSPFYITHNSKKKHVDYWTDKDNIVLLHTLHANKIDISKLPKPVNFCTKNIDVLNNTITLIKPFKDSITKNTYSAGTRFVRVSKKTSPHKISVYIFDRKSWSIKTTLVPKKKCVIHKKLSSKTKRIKMLLRILKDWANQKHGAIPYVWGGCSVIDMCNVRSFTKKQRQISNNKTVSFYTLPNNNQFPKTGVDCTGVMVLATRIAGIPYFYKNSTTVAQSLKPIGKNEQLVPGDIIWIPGHIMVVSDIEKNKIIEARSYDHGYGGVQEILLQEEFKNMRTFKNLRVAVQNNKPIKRLNKNGDVIKIIRSMKLLKLSSVW